MFIHPIKRLSVEALRNFSGSRICVLLDLQRREGSDDEQCRAECTSVCVQLCRDVLASGHSTLTLAFSDLVEEFLGDVQVVPATL